MHFLKTTRSFPKSWDIISFLLLLFLLQVITSCRKEEPIVKPESSINSIIDDTEIPEVPEDKLKFKDSVIETILINGKTSNCLTYLAQRTQRIESFDYLYSQDQSEIWPGSIVQSKYLRNDGRLISIGDFPRDPLNYNIIGTMGSKGFKLNSPNRTDFNTQMDDHSKLFWFMPPIFTTQKIQTTYSTEQGLIDLGINFGFLSNNLKSSFQILNTSENSTMYMLVKSIYFNVTVDYPSKPSDFFGVETKAENLERVTSQDNSPAYISNVSYGRFALIKLNTKSTQQKTKLAIDLYFKGLTGSLTTEQKKILQELELTVEAAPGSSTLLKTIDEVYDFINDGYQFNHRTGYVPVGFEARYLKDNSPLITHTYLEYKVISCL